MFFFEFKNGPILWRSAFVNRFLILKFQNLVQIKIVIKTKQKQDQKIQVVPVKIG